MAKKINIPFMPESEKPMLTGKKTCTTRTKRYGHAGDYFPAFGKMFVLTDVYRTVLGRVVNFAYKEEGFDSPQELIAFWNRLHPDVTYEEVRDRLVYIHHFRPLRKAYPSTPGIELYVPLAGVAKPK